MDQRLEATIRKLLEYCRSNDWAGYDPYDALNSRILAALPFLDSRIPRLVLTQALKRSPVNIRQLALVPKMQNAKAFALFLSSLLKLSEAGCSGHEHLIELMIERLIALRSPDLPYWCWGYSFPWQTRRILVPANAPNAVCTSFVASALLDCYERRGDQRCLEMAASAADYLLNDLYWTNGSSAAFAYPVPSARVQVYNANLLAAALLCRVAMYTGRARFRAPALTAARSSAARQQPDGSWPYGELPSQKWIDNFHTGYNLCALQSISRSLATSEFDACIRRGFKFYNTHFLSSDGAPGYFSDSIYPIDSHCIAQTIITLVALRSLDSANLRVAYSVFRWAVNNMWDDRGFFYYRALRMCTIKTSYMRWSQAWMALALSTLLCGLRASVTPPHTSGVTVIR